MIMIIIEIIIILLIMMIVVRIIVLLIMIAIIPSVNFRKVRNLQEQLINTFKQLLTRLV